MKTKVRNNLDLIIGLIILILFVCFFFLDSLNYIQHNLITYDDAYNATVSANLFRFGKYMVSYPDNIIFYNMITTGPVVLVPTALLYRLFGINNITTSLVPLLYSVFSIFLLWLINFFMFKKYKYKAVLSAIITVFLCGTNNLFTYISTHLIGESAALFFCLLSSLFLILYFEKKNKTMLLLSGGFLAVSFLTKSSMIFFVVSFFGLLLIETILRKIKLKYFLYFLLGFIVFFIIFDSFKFFQLGGIHNYIVYWKDEWANMLNQSSGVDTSVSFSNKFAYLNQIFGINKYSGLVATILPIAIYGYYFVKRIFKIKIEDGEIIDEIFSISLVGVAAASLIVYFLLLGGSGLMYARRLIVNSMIIDMTAVIIFIKIIDYLYMLFRKNNSQKIKITCLTILILPVLLLFSLFPINNIKMGIHNLTNKQVEDSYEIGLLNNLKKTIGDLGDDITIYSAGWWQEPNITLMFPSISMHSIFDVAYSDLEFDEHSYFVVGNCIDAIKIDDLESLLDIKLIKVNDNEIDYNLYDTRFNRMDFDLFSVYEIQFNESQ